MEVEKKGGGSFPSNYVTIHQLRQRWLQQHQSSASSSLSPVISESNHCDDDDVESSAAASRKPQNDAVSAHSPPAVTKSPPYNNNNKASSNPNQQPPLSPISSSGASKKKPQNDAVSPPPPAKTKSPPPPSSYNDQPPPPPPQQNHHNEIVSKTLNETRFRKGHNPNRLLPPQKPKPEPEPTDNVLLTTTFDTDNDQPISINNNNQLSKKNKYKKSRNPKRVLPDGAGSLPATDPRPELELEAEAVVVVVVEREQEPRELGGRRKSNKKKAVREFKDKAASFDQNKHAVVGDNVVEPEAKPELEQVEAVVEKRQKPRETRGRRDWNNKAVREFKPKTASFRQHDYNSNVANNNDDGGVKAVEVDKVVGDGDVVKENSRRGSGKLDHQGQGQGQGQGKQSLKTASFDHDQDMSATAVKERDAVNNNNNNYKYYHNTNATSDRGSNWRRGSGRFSGQGIRRPLIATTKGKVWVKKGESTTPN